MSKIWPTTPVAMHHQWGCSQLSQLPEYAKLSFLPQIQLLYLLHFSLTDFHTLSRNFTIKGRLRLNSTCFAPTETFLHLKFVGWLPFHNSPIFAGRKWKNVHRSHNFQNSKFLTNTFCFKWANVHFFAFLIKLAENGCFEF